MAQPIVYDGRNLYDPATVRALGFEHVGIGRGTAPSLLAAAPERLRA